MRDESGSVIASWLEIRESLESWMLGDCSMVQANDNGFIVQNCDVNCFDWNVCDCAPVVTFWRNNAYYRCEKGVYYLLESCRCLERTKIIT